jgi:hypothetical protein
VLAVRAEFGLEANDSDTFFSFRLGPMKVAFGTSNASHSLHHGCLVWKLCV